MKPDRVSDISVFPTAQLIEVWREDQQHLYQLGVYQSYSLESYPATTSESDTAFEQVPGETHGHIKV